MEKDYRLFVKNLPLNITEARIKELFGNYAAIKNIDLKEKKNLDNKINKFAFVNVTTTDKNLHTCFSDLNGERINGFQISVELAKESFLERLKRERTEKETKSQPPTIPTKKECLRLDFFNNADRVSSAKHKTFSDADFSSKSFQIEVQKSKNKNNKDTQEEIQSGNETLHVQTNLDQENFKSKVSKELDEFVKPNKKIVFCKDGLESEQMKVKINWKNKSFDSINNRDCKNQSSSQILNKPVVISESEKKRLISLKLKKQAFKTQEQAIRDALKCVDKNQSSNKIVFDDDNDVEITKTKTEKYINKNNFLFDSDENEDKIDWDEVEIDAKAQLKRKLLKLQTNIGNDKRFVLDKRFVDDEDVKEENKQNNVYDVEDERKWQLEILGNVLGKSIKPPIDSDRIIKKNKMIRYDPTASNHQDYEVNVEKSKEEKPVKKRKLNSTEIQEEPMVPRSNEVFYDVSEKLVESLKQNEGFSLLKSFGRDILENDYDKQKTNDETQENKGSFQFNFSAKNPFKYDSSDDEDGNVEPDRKSNVTDIKTKGSIFTRQRDGRLFFSHNDPRFEEAEEFFKTKTVQEEGAFKDRRRELKEIVRSKIRNNLKKKVPWNRRKVRKIQKK